MTNEQIDRGLKKLRSYVNWYDGNMRGELLLEVLEAMRETEKSYHSMNEGIPYKQMTSSIKIKDPIREVYEKYKPLSSEMLEGALEIDMWNAIKLYCEKEIGL